MPKYFTGYIHEPPSENGRKWNHGNLGRSREYSRRTLSVFRPWGDTWSSLLRGTPPLGPVSSPSLDPSGPGPSGSTPPETPTPPHPWPPGSG